MTAAFIVHGSDEKEDIIAVAPAGDPRYGKLQITIIQKAYGSVYIRITLEDAQKLRDYLGKLLP
jgi:hypothetical protein